MPRINKSNNVKNPKTSHQGPSNSSPATTIADLTSKFSFGQKRKFDDKTKKKKTYMGRCKRLLNNMVELDDSRPFRTAVDKLKFPDYHTSVRYDIDLSKIATKLDTGHYVDPQDFGRDIRLMITNWKDYIKDPSQPIYGQVTRLSWWFESEFSKIIQAHDDHKAKKRRVEINQNSVSTPGPSNSTSHGNIPTPPHLMSSVVENGRLKITRAPRPMNKDLQARLGAQAPGAKSGVQVRPVRNQVPAARSRFQWKAPGGTQNTTPTTTSSTTTPTTTSSSGTLVTTLRVMNAMREAMTLATRSPSTSATSSASPTPIVQRSTAAAASSSRPNQPSPSSPALRRPATATPLSANTSSTNVLSASSAAATPATSRPTPTTSKITSQEKKNPEIELMFTATHVWYGEFKNKPQKDIKFTEVGLEFPLKALNTESIFCVQPSDIVRCCGHFGNLGKLQNTLFLFLSPACTKRLKQAVSDLGVDLEVCSLIVIFGQNLTTEKISRLIHIFWVMSRSSVFGPLFSEVDKKGALSILANIKPQILQKLSGAPTSSGSSTPVNKDSESPTAVPATTPTSLRPMPNLSRAVSPGSPRVRRNSSTDAVASSTTSDRLDPENRTRGNRLAGNQAVTYHDYTFQRSRLPGNHNGPRFGPPQQHNHIDQPGPFGMQQSRGFFNPGPHQQRGEPRFGGPIRPMMNQPRFRGQQRNHFHIYDQPFQQQHQQLQSNPQQHMVNALRDMPMYDQFNDPIPPWQRNRGTSSQQAACNDFQNLENTDFTQDDIGDDIETFCQESLAEINQPPMQILNEPETDIQPANGYHPTTGVSSSEDQTNHTNNDTSAEEESSIRSVEMVRQTDSEDNASSGAGARDQILIHFSQPLTVENVQETANVVPPSSALDPMRTVDNVNIESSVSSTDQSVTAVISELALAMPHLELPDQRVNDVALEPVSSSAPPDITGDVNSDMSVPLADDAAPASEILDRADSIDFATDQVDMASSISDDDDLEIIIPSDNEDDLAFVPARQEKTEDGEDLVMTATRISTKCPVTQQIMRRPVKNRHCGHCYDRDGIQQLIINRTTKARCPVPGCSNPNALVMPDMEFDRDLFEYIRTHNSDKDLQKELDSIHNTLKAK